MGKLSKHFRAEEFLCPCGECDGGTMSMFFINRLEVARALAKVPFIITSGYRCRAHNTAIGGANLSAHMYGLAADILAEDAHTRFLIVKALIQVGFTRIGIYEKHIHVDYDRKCRQDIIFVVIDNNIY